MSDFESVHIETLEEDQNSHLYHHQHHHKHEDEDHASPVPYGNWNSFEPSSTSHSHSTSFSSPSKNVNTILNKEALVQQYSKNKYFLRIFYLPLFAIIQLSLIAFFFFPIKRGLGLTLSLSWNLEELRSILSLLRDETVWNEYWFHFMGLFSSVYLFNQTFCVPGSVLMNLLAGAVFGLKGMLIVAFLTATGASCAYSLSYLVGREYFHHQKFLKEKLVYLKNIIKGTTTPQLLLILTALRIFPFTPNFAVNIAAPHLNVPIYIFFPSVALGLLPFHFVTTSSGQYISELKSTNDIYQVKTIVILVLLSLLLAVPALLQRTNMVKKLFKQNAR